MRRKLWTATDASLGEIFHTGACDQGLAVLSELHRPCNDAPNPLRRLDKVRVGKVGVARGGPVPPMPKQLPDQRQVLARHDGLAGRRVPEVMQAEPAEPGIGADRPPVIRQNPDTPAPGMPREQECIRTARAGQRVDERPRGLTERHRARAALRVFEIDGVLADVAPAQIEHFAAAASERRKYNAQAAVDAGGSQLIVGARIGQCASDRNDLVADIAAIPAVLGRPETVLADNGYANGAEVAALEARGIEVLVSTAAEGRRRTHDFRPAKALPAAKEPKAEWLKAMAGKLASEQGRARYKLRRQTVEPVFGVIKAVLGFAGFSLRGLDKVEGEWTLVALAYNCKRLHKLSLAT